ncbi:class I SAM-dependent methyltransferase [Ramlibacter sp. GTP1]|uniref:Class I SAM-dependent methyltransferase n=2 Tax=Ramlibacter albus TaxID=2079448 RepID=A0A923M8X7_9BURK|nr:class I SAM-dependent methyltransferase [Ramlibacter albus]
MDTADLWMDRWIKLLRAGAGNGFALELGCDNGRDTAWLVQQGLSVVATDISADALRVCKRAVPETLVVQHDITKPLPFADASFGAVIASLSLHYFPWKDTQAAVAEIRRVLKPPFGILLVRLNSTRDVYHGAGDGGREIERHYYEVEAKYADRKRFFDKGEVMDLFKGWKVLSCNEQTIHRYEKPKVVWEVVAR